MATLRLRLKHLPICLAVVTILTLSLGMGMGMDRFVPYLPVIPRSLIVIGIPVFLTFSLGRWLAGRDP